MNSEPRRRFDMESLVGYILMVGVLASILLLVVGTVWQWLAAGTLDLGLTVRGMNVYEFVVSTVGELAAGHLDPRTVVELGVCVLILTPYTRVLASMLYFAAVERNWKYTLFTLVVLAVLTYALVIR